MELFTAMVDDLEDELARAGIRGVQFSVNNVALVGGRPKTLNLKDLIKYYVEHRHHCDFCNDLTQEFKLHMSFEVSVGNVALPLSE